SANDARFSADPRLDTYADGHHKYMSRINATRFWRIRAIESEKRRPISGWSVARKIAQYDSAYDRIKSTGQVWVYISDAEIQGAFKWLDNKGEYRGFDIKLARRIVDELAAGTASPLELVRKPVAWSELLDMPRQGRADF